jgi:dethiobiotin synthetase
VTPVRGPVVVTGTDTGVGKTVATAALACKLTAEGKRVVVVKPAQTGVEDDEPGDAQEVTRLSGVPAVEGVRLRHALAPVAAARLEGAELPDLRSQRDLVLNQDADHVLVEGAGGVLVQLGENFDLLDLGNAVAYAGVEVDVVVVVRAGLGTLNHSALTVREIARRDLTVAGLVVGSWPETPDVAEDQNLRDLPAMTGVPILGRLEEGAAGWGRRVFRERSVAALLS